MSEMDQAFADAVCNMRRRTVRYLDPEVAEDHERQRYRGIEGRNGVACDQCKRRAQELWAEWHRIQDKVGGVSTP